MFISAALKRGAYLFVTFSSLKAATWDLIARSVGKRSALEAP
jgi:hypothetical protein